MWAKIGLNFQDEWIEEHTQKKMRRVLCPSAPVLENRASPSARFARLTSSLDYASLIRSLSKPYVFKSYTNLRNAFVVWSVENFGKKFLDFKTDVETEMARQVWNAYIKGEWSDQLPLWDLAITRPGAHSWPLAIDLFLNDRLPSPLGFQDFKKESAKWIKSENSSRTSCVLFGKAKIYVDRAFLNETVNLDTDPRTPQKPPTPIPTIWSSEYIPFSGPSEEVGYTDPLLNQALRVAMKNVLPEDIACDLDFLPKDCLSQNQQDAAWMALAQLSAGQSFLLSDDTGYGKGRVLSAICRYALEENIQILFVTEKKSLFSDFYRDCVEIFDKVPDLFLLHGTAKVFDQKNQKVPATVIKEPKKEPWIWTTYSQFNRLNKEKEKAVLGWMKKPTWIILDEAQNAAGQSNTFKSFSLFIKKAKASLFSSATFAKREEQLEVYRPLFQGDQDDWEKLRHAFGQSHSTRSAVTLDWAQNGAFIRRQHPPMSLPEAIWVSSDDKAHATFVSWWQSMYVAAKELSKSTGETPWKKIGAMLSRAQREFSMLQKINTLGEEIKKSLDRNEKVVVVSDWTLSSHVARLIDQQEERVGEEENDHLDIKENIIFSQKPLWKLSWASVVRETFPDNMKWNKKIITARDAALSALNSMPDWGVSPFDDLKQKLASFGIKVGEVSGRSWQIIKSKDDYVVSPRDADGRVQTVYDFNNGDLDVVLLTRAGNSGTSLHAGKNFKDQRVRHLIEWDVSPDPSVRLQFWGRVRRRDQIHEPVRSTLLENTLYEKRRHKIDLSKQQKLLAHSGSWQSGGRSHLWERFLLQQWSLDNQAPARILGYYEETTLHTIMGRAVILKEADQEKLSNIVLSGLDLLLPLDNHLNAWEEGSVSLRTAWWAGSGNQSLVWHDRLWPMRPSAQKEQIARALSETSLSPVSGHTWPENSSWNKLKKGCSVLVLDPQTGERVQAIVLGFEKGSMGFVTDRVELWLCTWTKKMVTSLFALLHPGILKGEFLSEIADVACFDAGSYALKSTVLVGPAWGVASWGEKHAPSGELIQLHGSGSHFLWGWRLPSEVSLEKALCFDRPLNNNSHAFLFMKNHPHSSLGVDWRDYSVRIKPQSDGIFAESSLKSFANCVPFQIRKKITKQEITRQSAKWIIPWSAAKYVLSYWEGSGASFNVDKIHTNWVQKSWPLKNKQ